MSTKYVFEEQLIMEVEAHREIYDKSDPNHKLKGKIEEAWREIAFVKKMFLQPNDEQFDENTDIAGNSIGSMEATKEFTTPASQVRREEEKL
ncbi:hypothetical protein Bhyg_08868, partial [Pseudolycoriella hygida]